MFNKRNEQGNGDSIADVYQQHGVPLQRAINHRVAGWQTVLRALAVETDPETKAITKPARLQVFDTCVNLIRTLPLMQHDPVNVEDVADRLNHVKTEDHAADTLRYGLVAEQVPTSTSYTE